MCVCVEDRGGRWRGQKYHKAGCPNCRSKNYRMNSDLIKRFINQRLIVRVK